MIILQYYYIRLSRISSCHISLKVVLLFVMRRNKSESIPGCDESDGDASISIALSWIAGNVDLSYMYGSRQVSSRPGILSKVV
jgi:hypothetical protein